MIRRGIVLALASGLVLGGCAASADDVNDAVGDLPGVISAEPDCHEFLCTVKIEAEPTASATELAAMIAAARTVDDAWDVEVSLARDLPGQMSATLAFDHAPAAEDPAVAELLAWAAPRDDVASFAIDRSTPETVRVSGSAEGETSIWPLARAIWPLAEKLRGAQLAFINLVRPQEQSLHAEGAFPEESVTVAEELEADGVGLTGVLITNERFLVGAYNLASARGLRAAVADDPRLAGVAAEVVVTRNVSLAATAVEPGTSQRLDPVLAALDGQPGVESATLAGGTVVVQVDNLSSVARLVARVRSRAGAAFVDTTLELTDPDAEHRIEITPDGDDATLDLLLALLPTPGLRGMGVGQELELEPDRAAVSLGVTVRQPGPGTGNAPPVGPEVTRLARLLSTTPGSAASYYLSVDVEDADGRSADVGWRVDRTPTGFEIVEIRGTEETQAEVRAAWAQGVG